VRHFSLQYTKYSREKMASSGEKSLAVGHISGFQIDPNQKGSAFGETDSVILIKSQNLVS